MILLVDLIGTSYNSGIKLGICRDLLILINLINICLRQILHINEGDYITKQLNEYHKIYGDTSRV